jgi:hypothetical protein
MPASRSAGKKPKVTDRRYLRPNEANRLIDAGSVQRMGDQAALASGSFLLACGLNRWPNPEPSVPL